MRGALVLFEGLPATVIDSQVFAHVRLARELLGIDLAVIAVACSSALHESSQQRLARAREAAGGTVTLLRGVRPALPGSLTANRLILARAMAGRGPIDFLHARADYAAAVAGPWGRRQGVPVLWDCRGDSRAELEERVLSSVPLLYRSCMLERELRIAGGTCSGALFVTAQLREAMAPYMIDQRSWVIPCLAPEGDFFFDTALRERVRRELGISQDETVYVYSGSLATYQCFEQTIAAFKVALTDGQNARLIVLTPEVERARRVCADVPMPRIIVKSVQHADVNAYLNAADFGMLLRDSSPVNVVAFPTKFAEYAMAGLKVVMKASPPACVAMARQFGNDVTPGHAAAPWSVEERVRCASSAAQALGRRAAMPIYSAIYAVLARGGAEQSAPATPSLSSP
jgi:hypothetical protein